MSERMEYAVAGMNILITGAPGCGKTTFVENVARELAGLRPAGFVTREIREAGERKGFALVSLCGRTGILAHVGIRSPLRVGKYGVDVPAFEAFLQDLQLARARLVIIDEIGKMECLSPLFRTRVAEALDSPCVLVATIALRGTPPVESLKARRDVEVFCLHPWNRQELAGLVTQRVKSVLNNAGSTG
jgi:nucleoside-triphosphatase